VFKSWKQPIGEIKGKSAYIRPKVVGSFPDPAQVGAMCNGLPFFVNIIVYVFMMFGEINGGDCVLYDSKSNRPRC
jgi:hypothetical protein